MLELISLERKMKMRQEYKVKRDNVYVGRVMYYSQNKQIPMRSMLFEKTCENLADDLLYDTPYYPIAKKEEDKKQNFVVDECWNLGQLLNYLGFPEELTKREIQKVRKIFQGSFLKKYCVLFGMRQVLPEERTYHYLNGEEITNFLELKAILLREKLKRKKMRFVPVEMIPRLFPEEMMRMIRDRSDNYQEMSLRRNAFRPKDKEGNLRKLYIGSVLKGC